MHIYCINYNEETQSLFIASIIAVLFKETVNEHPKESTFADTFFKNLFNDEELDFDRDFF